MTYPVRVGDLRAALAFRPDEQLVLVANGEVLEVTSSEPIPVAKLDRVYANEREAAGYVVNIYPQPGPAVKAFNKLRDALASEIGHLRRLMGES